MDRVNPVYIPRNHLVEQALSAATEGDLDPLNQLLDAVAAPYEERPGLERYAATARRTSAPTRPSAGPDVRLRRLTRRRLDTLPAGPGVLSACARWAR